MFKNSQEQQEHEVNELFTLINQILLDYDNIIICKQLHATAKLKALCLAIAEKTERMWSLLRKEDDVHCL